MTALLSIGFCQNLLNEKAVASAHELWREGKQTDAIEKYRFALDNVSAIDREDRSMIFERVIEFEVASGNVQLAESLIQKAMQYDVALSFKSEAANSLLADAIRATKVKEAAKDKKSATVAKAEESNSEQRKDIAKIGEVVELKDSQWIVLKVKDRGKKMGSRNRFAEPATTDGRFIEVRFKVTNKKSKEKRILEAPKVRDQQGREFRNFDRQAIFIPKGKKTMTLEALPASMTREFWAIYEVAADSKGLQFQARSFAGVFTEYRWIDLDL